MSKLNDQKGLSLVLLFSKNLLPAVEHRQIIPMQRKNIYFTLNF